MTASLPENLSNQFKDFLEAITWKTVNNDKYPIENSSDEQSQFPERNNEDTLLYWPVVTKPTL